MNIRISLPCMAILALAACATTQQNDPEYQHAKSEIDSASNDPAVAQYAPAELSRARQELNLAQAAKKRDEIDQHAYLAARHVELARAQAQEAVARAFIAQGEQQRTQIQLQARTAEAQRAQRQAEAAQAQAAAATNEAAEARGQSQQLQQQSQQLQQQAQQLQQQLQQLQAKETNRGIVITLNDVLFDTGKSDLKPGAYRSLDRIVSFLKDHSERQVSIDGFTDSVGGDEYNQQLSQRRADAVKEALVGEGVTAERIQARGYGKSFPVASNGAAAGRQLNRRVEIVISNGANAVAPRGEDQNPGGQG